MCVLLGPRGCAGVLALPPKLCAMLFLKLKSTLTLLLKICPQRLLTFEVLCKHLSMILLLFSQAVMSDSLQPHGLQHTRLPCLSLSP